MKAQFNLNLKPSDYIGIAILTITIVLLINGQFDTAIKAINNWINLLKPGH